MRTNFIIRVFTAGLVMTAAGKAETTSSSFQYSSRGGRIGGAVIVGGSVSYSAEASPGAHASAGAGFGFGPGGPGAMRGGNVFYIVPKSASRARGRAPALPNAGSAVAGQAVTGPTPTAVTEPAAPIQEPVSQAPLFYLGDAPSGLSLSTPTVQTQIANEAPTLITPARQASAFEKKQKERTERVQPISEVKGPAFDDRDPLLGYQRSQAEKGNPEAQFALGVRHLTGNGVEQNETLGRQWLEKASAQGNLRARSKLRELRIAAGES